ncbi:MAG TPA: SH3 domain-containing protein [Kiritimatiellia bacterium]|nr:SH3 domain-containing protein [Kiritimatiellia bacterium]
MKRIRWKMRNALVAGLALLALPVFAAREMSVQVEETAVRSRPSFMGAPVVTVRYGDRLAVQSQQQAWVQVRTPGGETGWVHESALTTRRVVLAAQTEDVRVGATTREVALAGKGFNSEVEADFKARNEEISFVWIDRMEAIRMTEREIKEFLIEGGIQP